MGATLQTVAGILKEVYQGKIQNQLQDEAVGLKRLERTSDGVESRVGGKYVTFPIRTRRNHGIGYRNENEQLQAAGQQGTAAVQVKLKYGYGRLNITGQTMELAESDYQAFAAALDMEMTGLKNDIAKDCSRIFYGDGKGTLATLSSASQATANTSAVVNTKYLEAGQQIDILSADGLTTRGANRQITSITAGVAPAGTFVYDGADIATDANTDIVVRTGNYGREPNGLKSIVTATGALFGVNPTTEPSWAAIVDSNGGTNRALSEGLMIALTDRVRMNGGKTSLILVPLGVRRAYFNLLSQQRRYTNTTEFAGGLKGLAFNNGTEIPVVEDVDAPDNTMWFLDEDSLKIYRDKDWSWLDRDGNIFKWVTGYDAYEAVLKQYWEIGVNRRNANAVAYDVAEG